MKVRECAGAGASAGSSKLFLMLVTENQRKSGIPVLQAQQESEQYLDMGLLSISVVAYTDKVGQLVVDM